MRDIVSVDLLLSEGRIISYAVGDFYNGVTVANIILRESHDSLCIILIDEAERMLTRIYASDFAVNYGEREGFIMCPKIIRCRVWFPGVQSINNYMCYKVGNKFGKDEKQIGFIDCISSYGTPILVLSDRSGEKLAEFFNMPFEVFYE